MEGKCPPYTVAKCSSCNMTVSGVPSKAAAKSVRLTVLHAEAKDSGGNNGKMRVSGGRQKQFPLSPKSVMMSPFRGEHPGHKERAASSGEGRQLLMSSEAHHSPYSVLNPRSQRRYQQVASFNNSVNRSEVKANSVLLELDDLRSELRAQFTSAAATPSGRMTAEGTGGAVKEKQFQDGKDPEGDHHLLPEEKVELGNLELLESAERTRDEGEDDSSSQQRREVREETREERKDGSPLLEAVKEECDVHKLQAAQTIQR